VWATTPEQLQRMCKSGEKEPSRHALDPSSVVLTVLFEALECVRHQIGG
jgi:hypothetical protein